MRFKRSLIFKVLTLLLLATTVVTSWSKPDRLNADSKKQPSIAQEENALALQSRLMLGLASPREGKARASGAVPLELANQVYHTFEDGLIDGIAVFRGSPRFDALLLEHAILARYFGYEKLCKKIFVESEAFAQKAGLGKFARDLCRPRKEADANSIRDEISATFDTETIKELRIPSWFKDVLSAYVRNDDAQRDRLESNASRSIKLMGLAVLIPLFSGFVFVLLLFTFILGRTSRKYLDAGMSTDFCLEIFCIYLAGMLLVSQIVSLLQYFEIKIPLLPLSLVSIAVLSLLIFWPRWYGVSFNDISVRLGFRFPRRISELLKESIVGPVTYVACILPFLIALSLYALVLMYLEVDPAGGAHPVVPLLTRSTNPSLFYLIFVMAVITAPFVEELMFRGALYSWLRERMGASLAIFVSAVIFAIIHPQGAIGVFPLTLIGMMLGFLREWRGSLLAPMLAHACVNGVTLTLVVTLLKGG